MKDASSTDVIVHRGTALTSFYQCGDLYRLDPYSGDTLGKEDWGGAFPFDWGVSAHPKVDDRTGELLFFNYSKQAPYMHYGVVDERGSTRALRRRRPARPAAAARHGVHRELRHSQRLSAVLGT